MAEIFGSIFAAAATFIASFLAIRRAFNPKEGPIRNQHVLRDQYDFIVIGGGSAGAAVAGRLSEVPHWKVLVLEAGPDEHEIGQIPAAAALLYNSPITWSFESQPDPNFCLGLNGQVCHWSVGKVLGGSSSINYMVYSRGNRRDFDAWAALGNEGWSYSDVLPYFIKSEANTNRQYVQEGFHGSRGPLTVGESPYSSPIGSAFLQAGVQMGYPIRDGNGAHQTGFMKCQGTVRKGSRCSTSKAYLRPARNRPNLHIAQNALVEKVLVDSQRVVGVQFIRRHQRQVVRCVGEVILSAGALLSPQILMLSGIGPSQHLRETGIRPLVDLPGVGQNLVAHIGPGGLIFHVNESVTFDVDRDFGALGFIDWTTRGTGPLSSIAGVETISWMQSRYADPTDDIPDIQFHFGSGSILSDDGGIRKTQGISDEIWKATYSAFTRSSSWSVVPMIMRPQSRGHLKLRSSNIKDQPLFYPNYLSDPQDVRILIESMKMTLALSLTPALQRYNSTFHPVPIPQCRHLTFLSDEYLECQLRHIPITFYHFVGTAKMGPDSDPMAVVDNRLRVKNVAGLRVVDCSIMPAIIGGSPVAAAVMIAEKAADIIKQDWGLLWGG